MASDTPTRGIVYRLACPISEAVWEDSKGRSIWQSQWDAMVAFNFEAVSNKTGTYREQDRWCLQRYQVHLVK